MNELINCQSHFTQTNGTGRNNDSFNNCVCYARAKSKEGEKNDFAAAAAHIEQIIQCARASCGRDFFRKAFE
jgi:hypothetical protein